MSTLELKVPPDVVALAVAGLMWLASTVTPSLNWPGSWQVPVAILLFVAGIALIVLARIAFAKADTTFSPLAPERSSRLVTTGVYRLTRNPMYLGTFFALLALAARLSNPAAAIAALLYVAYMNHFQIRPEEGVLRERFGSTYEAYTRRVRRWI
jgi:protein-S-isoprenylcysteine O-methyltransferase Ste14